MRVFCTAIPFVPCRLTQRREHVGVQLYGMQQQLARLQVSLEQSHADFNVLGEDRARTELDADTAKRRHAELKEASEAASKRVAKNESELNALQDTLLQVWVLRCSAGCKLLARRTNIMVNCLLLLWWSLVTIRGTLYLSYFMHTGMDSERLPATSGSRARD